SPRGGTGPRRTGSGPARTSDAERALAGLPGAHGGGGADDRVGPGRVGRPPLDGERAAGGPGGRRALGERGAVAAQRPVPVLAVAVRVDLELHLEAAVVGLGLPLPVGGTAAAAGADDGGA